MSTPVAPRRAPRRLGSARIVRRALVALAVACAAGAAGCGIGAGDDGPTDVSLTVTDGFGARELAPPKVQDAPGSETVMRLLQRSFDVTTRYGGGFVQSIDGLEGGGRNGSVDWFYYVNGIEASKGAAATKVHAGDRIWWDRHTWRATMRIPAVVGSFPEPFLSGSGGKRLPVRIDCGRGVKRACDVARDRLAAAGASPASAVLGAPVGTEVLRVLVGTWKQLRPDPAAALLAHGPEASGIYARFARDGRELVVLDPAGRPTRRLGAGAGLVAATRYEDQQPAWLVTGTDEAGVEAAASALEEGALSNHFALAIDGGRAVRVPEVAR